MIYASMFMSQIMHRLMLLILLLFTEQQKIQIIMCLFLYIKKRRINRLLIVTNLKTHDIYDLRKLKNNLT